MPSSMNFMQWQPAEEHISFVEDGEGGRNHTVLTEALEKYKNSKLDSRVRSAPADLAPMENSGHSTSESYVDADVFSSTHSSESTEEAIEARVRVQETPALPPRVEDEADDDVMRRARSAIVRPTAREEDVRRARSAARRSQDGHSGHSHRSSTEGTAEETTEHTSEPSSNPPATPERSDKFVEIKLEKMAESPGRLARRASASDGTFERNLIAELCPPGNGGIPVPPSDKLGNFARNLNSLNADLICVVLLDFVEVGKLWVVRAKALCVVEVAIQKGLNIASGANPYKAFFTACSHRLQPLTAHPREAISEPTKRILTLLGIRPAAPREEAPALTGKVSVSSLQDDDDSIFRTRSNSRSTRVPLSTGTPITLAASRSFSNENFVDDDRASSANRSANLTPSANQEKRDSSFISRRPSILRAMASKKLLVACGPDSDSRWQRERLKLGREVLAELLGTFILVWFGTGSIFSAVITGALQGLWQVAAVWIIGVTIAIATTASISGAHLNPAISVAFALLRPGPTFGWSKVIPYVLAQVLGAILAAWANLMLYASAIREFEAENEIIRSSANAIPSAKCFGMYFVDPISTAQAFFAEALSTAILAGVVFSLTHPGNDTMKHNVYIPPFIGLTVGGLISVIAPLTQCGMNPARDIGPRLVAFAAGWTEVAFDGAWLYLVAPMVGAPIGAALVDKLAYAWDDEPTTAATTHDE